MRYLVSIHHPAQVHFYRHIIDELRGAGHEVRVCVREKDVAVDLLEAHGIEHRVLAETPDSLPRLAAMQLRYEYRLFREARRFRPDVMTSVGGVEISHVAPLVGARAVAFDDSEPTPSHYLTAPFLDAVCTPAAFQGDFGAAHRRYDGYHELAYLHPDRFDPDPDRLRSAGIDPEERYFVLRFVAWQAHHDVGEAGLSRAAKRTLVDRLSERGTVYITSEAELPPAFEEYRTPVPPHLVHDLLVFADLYVGDSQTMATEAAVLGTPAVRSNSFAGTDDMSNFVELEDEYGLLTSLADEDETLDRVGQLVTDPGAQETWARRRERLLSDKVDVTAFAADLLEEEGRAARASRAARAGTLGRMRDWLGGDSE
jgi:predicted glycosyltransferase